MPRDPRPRASRARRCRAPVWLAAGAALALAGCAQRATVGVNPNPPVPALPYDAQPLPPVSSIPLVWQPAHYDWTGATYQYVSGRYIEAPGLASWQPGTWIAAAGRWLWVPAHWVP